MVGGAADFLHSPLHVGIEFLRIGKGAGAAEYQLRRFSGDLPSCLRGARLDDDGPSLDRPPNIEWTADRKELALVIQDVQPLRIEKDATLHIRYERVVRPAVPQPGNDVEELAGTSIALAMLDMLL